MPRIAKSQITMQTVKDIIFAAFGDKKHNTVDFKLIEAILLLLAHNLRMLERRFWVALDTFKEPTPTDMTVTEVNIRAKVPKKTPYREQTGTQYHEQTGRQYREETGTQYGEQAGTQYREQTGTKKSDERDSTFDYIEKDQFQITKPRKKAAQLSSSEETIGEKAAKTRTAKSKSVPASTERSLSTEKITGIDTSKKTTRKKAAALDEDTSEADLGQQYLEKGKQTKYEQKRSTAKKTTGRDADIGESDSDQNYLTIGSKKSTKEQRKKTTRDVESTEVSTSYKAERKFKGKQIGAKTDSMQDIESTLSMLSKTDSTDEMQYGKILVVEKKTTQKYGDGAQDKRERRRLSIATQDQFQHLVRSVQELNSQIGPIESATEVLEGLSKGTSYSDAMAGFMLGDRLNSLEKQIERMNTVLVKLVEKQTKATPNKQKSYNDKTIIKSEEINFSTKSRKSKQTTGTQSTAVIGRASISQRAIPDVMSLEEFNKTMDQVYDDFLTYTAKFVEDSDEASYSTVPDQQLNASASMDAQILNIDTYIVQYTDKTVGKKRIGSVSTIRTQDQQQIVLDGQTETEDTIFEKMIQQRLSEAPADTIATKDIALESKMKSYWVTRRELDNAIGKLPAEILNFMNKSTAQSANKAIAALKMVTSTGEKVQALGDFDEKMYNLEYNVAEFGGKITRLDCEVSTLTTSYQEQLTQMQQDLELKLDAMGEAMANKPKDTGAINEMNSKIVALEIECDKTTDMQTDLRRIQNEFECDLADLGKDIQLLSERKSDRDEVALAFVEKVGIDQLNGMVDNLQYSATRGDIEKRIRMAYDIFNNIESNWQRSLNELYRTLNERADIVQVDAYAKDVNFNINNLKNNLVYLEPLLGLARAESSKKIVMREDPCLSCSTHVQKSFGDTMLLAEGMRAEKDKGKDRVWGSKPKEYGDHKDHKLCYPGLPAPHVRDPRLYISKECTRYCTKVNKNTASSSTSSSIIGVDARPLIRERGDGAKTIPDKKPCKPCFLGDLKSIDSNYGKKRTTSK